MLQVSLSQAVNPTALMACTDPCTHTRQQPLLTAQVTSGNANSVTPALCCSAGEGRKQQHRLQAQLCIASPSLFLPWGIFQENIFNYNLGGVFPHEASEIALKYRV